MSKKNSIEIANDLKNISPLALPQYLKECEFYDMESSREILDRAVAEFEEQGGVGGSLAKTIVISTSNACFLALLRKFHEQTYNKVRKGNVNVARICERFYNFEYPSSHRLNLMAAAESFQQNTLRREMSGLSDHYDGNKDYRDLRPNNRNSEFKDNAFGDKDYTEDVTGNRVYKDENKAPKDANGKHSRADIGEADHCIPLKTLHENTSHFTKRYIDLDKEDGEGLSRLQKIVNDDENFQLLSGDKNASKGGGQTNIQYIAYCENIQQAANIKKQLQNNNLSGQEKLKLQKELDSLPLSHVQKKAANKMANYDSLSDKEKEDLKKYKLSDEAKEQLRVKQRDAERHLCKEFIKAGAETVILEQVGKIIEAIIGPVGFEIRDAFINGISYGFDDCNKFEAILKRIWRALKYTLTQLPSLIGDLLGDLSQMITTLFLSLCKMLRDLFGKLFDIVLSGISIIVESVKVLMTQGMSAAEKGDAICKIIASFVSGAVGSFAIQRLVNSLGLPEPFAEIVAVILSGVISAITAHIFNKLDIFGVKRELRLKRIKEIFDLRIEQLNKDSAAFNLMVSEKMKADRIQMEKLRISLNNAIAEKDFSGLSAKIDEVCDFFKVDVPYSNSKEFVEYIRNNSQIKIGC